MARKLQEKPTQNILKGNNINYTRNE